MPSDKARPLSYDPLPTTGKTWPATYQRQPVDPRRGFTPADRPNGWLPAQRAFMMTRRLLRREG